MDIDKKVPEKGYSRRSETLRESRDSSELSPSRAVMFTGQYATKTGVTQTDDAFKEPDDPNFPWLHADGYNTHYFGKCHFANPPNHSLEDFGFKFIS
ncbi:MAG: arylsulfatase A-like enzyme [Saprospiraceae bacterium]|jgi:arylsulfatase A-like enzyme